MSYDFLAHYIKIGGTVAFFGVFVLAILYAVWPSNKGRFKQAAEIPLNSDDKPAHEADDVR